MKRTSVRRALLFVPVAAVVTAAAVVPAAPAFAIEVPQTRREFVEAVAAGRGATEMVTFTAERGFDEVYALLQKKTAACLDVEIRRSGFVGNQMESSSSDYNPTLRKTGPGKAEFALQVVHRPRGVGHKPPPGGLYVMAADIRAAGRGRTRIVVYRPTIGLKKINTSFARWAVGEETACPKIR